MPGPTNIPFQKLADSICDSIRADAKATEEFVLDVQALLIVLPDDLGNPSLNDLRNDLLGKCRKFFSDE